MKKQILVILTLLAGLQSVSLSQDLDAADREPLEVVKEFLTAYMAKDHAKFASYLDPNVVWIQPGDNRIAGVKRTKQELLQMGAKMAELSAGTIRLVDVEYFSVNGNTVACLLHWTGAQPPGGTLDVTNIDIYTVEHGKIVMARIYSNDIEQEDRFWGK
ncbi:MAG: nuclear transport factor 2 family protein [Cyclobacteriaceae bacterium]